MKEKKRKKKGTREAQITQKTNPSSEGMSGPKCHPQGPRLLGLQRRCWSQTHQLVS